MWVLTPKLKEWFQQIPDTISEVSVQKSGGLEKRCFTEPENLQRTWGWWSHTSHTAQRSCVSSEGGSLGLLPDCDKVVIHTTVWAVLFLGVSPCNIRGNLLWFGAILIWIERKSANTCMWLDRCCVTMLSAACEICFCLTGWLWVINPRKPVLVRTFKTLSQLFYLHFCLANNSKIGSFHLVA